MRRVSSLILAIVLALTLALPALAAENRAASDPGACVERGAVVQTLYEREGSPMVIQAIAFDDTAGRWYASAATWAKGAGIVSGGADGRFDGERAVTRAELAAMLYRYVQTKGMGFTGMWAFRMDYTDVAEVPEWAYEAMAWCVMKGVMTADAAGKLTPAATVSRAELADMLSRLARVISEETALSLWTKGAPARNELIDYMAAITDESSADYIPVEDRIAVFDLDGTLFCETDPNYFDYTLLKYRVLEDPTYKDKASDFEKEVANKIKEQNETGKSFSGLEIDHGKAVASAFAGMTVGEFNEYIQKFKQQPMPSYDGMLRGEGWYEPMLQVVDFLKANDFTVYVVSGTDRLIVRGIAYNSPLGLPNGQIIGSDETIVASNQNGKDGLSYVYAEGDKLVLGGDFLIKNLKMNKVAVIAQEIGQQPVLSFGNSSGDASMANYVIQDNPHRAAAFMLCCDDLARENGNTEKAESMRASCEKNGWTPISMRDDWTTIYGPGVTYLGGTAAEIKARGVLRVGATGDYRPMSFRDPETGAYWGFDAELAEDLAEALGVKLEYVPTTWPTLMADTLAGKFDLAICGITVTDARKEQALMSDGYLGNGKTVLCRAEDAEKYASLEAIDRPEVTVMENPGGLNERFARENLPNATLVIHNVNEEIPGLVAAGEADVMITEILEAGWYVGQDSRLAAPLIYEPFTQGQLGVLMPKGSEALLGFVNAFLEKEKTSGRIDELAEQYIYRYIDGGEGAAA